MTGREAITRHAPGKLFIAGEYAVMEPGHPAILVAVDRGVGVTVAASPGAGVEIDSDLVPGGVRLRRGAGGLELPEGNSKQRQRLAGLTHVVSAIEVVDQWAAERGLCTPAITVSVRSGLHREGTKLGLGSSGAVTVAAVSAVAAYYGIELSPQIRFRLALLATARLGTGPSGGDLAAGVWGGWIAYQAPDRAAIADMAQHRGIQETIRAPWPGLGFKRLPQPTALALEVGWTGHPANTPSMRGQLKTSWGSLLHQRFLARSDECVRASVRALEQGDDQQLLQQITAARQVLAALDDGFRLGIFTPALTALCDATEALGGAAKPSGAGGGDCGIALLDAEASIAISRLREEWTAAGILPLPIRVQQTKVSTP